MKAIWESLDKPYRAALDQGLIYTRLGNPHRSARTRPRSAAAASENPLMTHPLRRRIADVLDLRPAHPVIEFDGRWSSWGQVGEHAQRIASLVGQRAGTHPQVGVLLRNTPEHVATFLGVLLAGATLVVINPARGDDRTRSDIAALRLPIVVGAPDDLATLVAPSNATTLLAISGLTDPPAVRAAAAGPADDRPGVAVRMLTSGTTGPPKRIDLTYDMLARSVLLHDGATPTEPPRGVAIVNAPLVHIGGVFRVLQCVTEARSFVLLPRFELDRWADAVRRHRPKTVSLVPAALRMVLHSDLSRDDLASIRAVTSGTAPLSAEDADAFTEKYGIPVLTSYAATEFGGGVASWTLPDHQMHWARQTWQRRTGQPRRTTSGGRRRRQSARAPTSQACSR